MTRVQIVHEVVYISALMPFGKVNINLFCSPLRYGGGSMSPVHSTMSLRVSFALVRQLIKENERSELNQLYLA